MLELRDVLTSPVVDRMELALRMCRLCNLPSEKIYEVYGMAELSNRRYKAARRTFDICFQNYLGDIRSKLIRAIVKNLEQSYNHRQLVLREHYRRTRTTIGSSMLLSQQNLVSISPSVEELQHCLQLSSSQLLQKKIDRNKHHRPNGKRSSEIVEIQLVIIRVLFLCQDAE